MRLHIGALAADFRTSSMRMRDCLYLEQDRLQTFIDAIPSEAPLRELVALSTCNRVELYYACERHEQTAGWLGDFLAGYHGIPRDQLQKALTNYRCADAVRHLFRVASGVESMVFGEHEILGQIRDAYFRCKDIRSTDSYLNRLFQQAIATGKQVRSRTAAGRGALSIASIAIERMLELAGSIDDKRILLVGLGAMGLRALKRLIDLKPGALALCNRTNSRAERFCKQHNAVFVPFAALKAALHEYDILILATASPTPLITRTDVAARPLRPLLVVDLGAPCNADAAIVDRDGVTLVCIDDLRETARLRLDLRKNELAEIETLIDAQVEEFTRWYLFRTGERCDQT
ncbi:MAG: glutamyl-tRNA reductase [Chitinispirillaceae bacterium]|nr:glutamyl-tRNA reductase [Chitinispirillaceae bacterium]